MESPINSKEKINKTFRLYDEVIWLAGAGAIYLTYDSSGLHVPVEQKLINMPGIVLLWIIILFKTHRIHVKDSSTVTFQDLLRKIVLHPKDIKEIQEWVRGARLVYKGGSIMLWPYIENQTQFNSLLKS